MWLVNVMAPFRLLRLALPHLRRAGHGNELVVRLHTDEGHVGVGEAQPAEGALLVAEEQGPPGADEPPGMPGLVSLVDGRELRQGHFGELARVAIADDFLAVLGIPGSLHPHESRFAFVLLQLRLRGQFDLLSQ